MRRPFVVVAAAVLAVGCQPPGDRPAEGDAATDGSGQADTRPTTAALTPLSRFQGIFTVDGGWSLVPCGEDPIPVEGPAIPQLQEVYDELVPDGAEGMFVDFLGQVRERGGDGWMEAMELRRAHFEGFGCNERDPGVQLSASGTEPFWSLEVSDETMVWRTPSGSRSFRHQGLKRSGSGSWAVHGVPTEPGADGSVALNLEAWDEPCRNSMSGAWNHLQVEINLDGERYGGCAYLGAEYEASQL